MFSHTQHKTHIYFMKSTFTIKAFRTRFQCNCWSVNSQLLYICIFDLHCFSYNCFWFELNKLEINQCWCKILPGWSRLLPFSLFAKCNSLSSLILSSSLTLHSSLLFLNLPPSPHWCSLSSRQAIDARRLTTDNWRRSSPWVTPCSIFFVQASSASWSLHLLGSTACHRLQHHVFICPSGIELQ